MGDVIEGQFGKTPVEEDQQSEATEAAATPAPESSGLVHQPAQQIAQRIERAGVNPLVVAGIITGTVAAFAIGLYALSYFQKSSAKEERRSRRVLAVGEMQEKAKKKVAAKRKRRTKPLPARGPVVEVD
jgi:hypothetical protein